MPTSRWNQLIAGRSAPADSMNIFGTDVHPEIARGIQSKALVTYFCPIPWNK